MTRIMRLALGFYVLATALGLALRWYLLHPFGGLTFGFALHAHSHTLYFGWVGLAIFALAFERLGGASTLAKATLGAIGVVSLATFVAFLLFGYGRPGIVVSSVALVVWLAAAIAWLRASRGQRGLELSYLRVGFVYVLLAGCGAGARVGLLVAKVQDAVYGQLAVFAFLHDFAWFFVFAVLGLILWRAPRLGLAIDEGAARRRLWWMAALAWLTFPLGVVGGTSGALGLVARGAALGLVVPGLGWAKALWDGTREAPQGPRLALRVVAGWLAAATLMEAMGALGLAEQAVAARHPALIYLHVLLLGFVTLGLAILVLQSFGRPVTTGLALHTGGVAVMCLGLALAGAPAMGLPLPVASIELGLLLAFAGGAGAVLAGVVWLTARSRALEG